jgi:hypothetical protein
VLLFLLLAAGAVTVAGASHPAHRQQADLVADLDAGRVTHLEFRSVDQQVRWVDGWWRWRETALESAPDNSDGSTTLPSAQSAAAAWLTGRVDASGHPVVVEFHDGQDSGWWVNLVVPGPLKAATGVAWLATLLIMLGRRRHRYANRWAWFWLFTVGQLGALLYLVLEPQPLWRPGSWPTRPARSITRGGKGFAWAIGLSFVTSLTVAGITVLQGLTPP